MKVGKVPENVLKRSVFKQLHTTRKEVLLGAGVGEDCAAMKLAEDEVFVISTDPITGAAKDIGALAVQITVNDLASAGAEPIGIMLTVLLPENAEEKDLKTVMAQVEEACEKNHIQVMGGHTEVTKVVNQIVISVTGVGKAKEGRVISTAGVKPGMDIIVTKWIGIEGTAILAKEKEAALREHYSQPFIDKAKELDRYISVLSEAATAVKSGVAAMHDVTEGGIFGALWEIAEASGVGLEIDLKKIPLKQETVEICEFFDLNPYYTDSAGALLVAVEDGFGLVSVLEREGIHAAVIGRTNDGNDRIIYNQGKKRYLDRPQKEELEKVFD